MSQDIRRHNEVVLQTLEMGDLVEFPGRIYSHWGVYIGECEIVHYTVIDRAGTATDESSSHVFDISGNGNEKACVKRENFWNVAKHSKAKKNNDKDRHQRPSSGEDIKERAVSKIGSTSYSVLLNNCEHFATWCRYGKGESQQLNAAVNVVEQSVGTVAVVAGGAAITYNTITRENDSKPGTTSYNATDFGNVIPGTPVLLQADTAINRGVTIGAVAAIGGLAHEETTGGNDRRSRPPSNSAIKSDQARAVLPLGCTSWVILGLAALVVVGKQCYDAYTDGNDRRAKKRDIQATEEAKQKLQQKRKRKRGHRWTKNKIHRKSNR